MTSDFTRRVFSLVEGAVHRRMSPADFELAYQARVAIDRIRFAIKVAERFSNDPELLREASFQLLDALDRLESAEQNFQVKDRNRIPPASSESAVRENASDPRDEVRRRGSGA